MSDILTYRFTNGDGLEERVKQAVTHFYTQYHHLPGAIIVNKKHLDAARDAAAGLELNMPIVTCGGCLSNEVWLEFSD